MYAIEFTHFGKEGTADFTITSSLIKSIQIPSVEFQVTGVTDDNIVTNQDVKDLDIALDITLSEIVTLQIEKQYHKTHIEKSNDCKFDMIVTISDRKYKLVGCLIKKVNYGETDIAITIGIDQATPITE